MAGTQKTSHPQVSQQAVNNFGPYAVRSRPSRKKVANANLVSEIRSHRDLIESNLGTEANALSFVEKITADLTLEKQTELVARKLENEGIEIRRKDSGLTLIGATTGCCISNEGWRNINILPVVAKRNRQCILNKFVYWRERDHKALNYSRYIVVSSGKTIPLSELPSRYDIFSKKVGKYVERLSEFDIECVLSSFEITFKRCDDGIIRCNLHCNLIVIPNRVLNTFDPETGEVKKEGWAEFLEWTRKHFKVKQIEDSGILRKPEEIIKYVCKPSELMILDSAETATLFGAVGFKKQLVRTYGRFQTWCRTLKDDKLKVVFDSGCRQFVLSRRRTKDEAVKDDISKDVRDREKREKATTSDRAEVENQIVFRTLPQAKTSLLKETFVGVIGYTSNPKTTLGKKGLETLERIHLDELSTLFAKGVKPCSRLDTCTIIPQFLNDIGSLPEKRFKKLLERIGFDPDTDQSTIRWNPDFTEKLKKIIDRRLDVKKHEWISIPDGRISEISDIKNRLDRGDTIEDLIPY